MKYSDNPAPSKLNRLTDFVANMSPSLFAIVMATGIVSMAASLHGMQAIGMALTVVNFVSFIVLWLLTLWRLVAFPKNVLADVSDVRSAFGFFTWIAAGNVLGVQAVRILKLPDLAFGIWCFSVGLWVLLTYAVFYFVMAHANKPDWREALGGGWLLAVVATQSCAVLGSQVAHGSPLISLATAFWFGTGALLYIVIISAIFFRLTLFELAPKQLVPPYWINMGAISITTLAGTRIINDAPHFPGNMGALLPFFGGITFIFWAFATWWIPLLILLGLWKHAITRLPLSFTPALWSMVFPLGMYATCTKMMEAAFHVKVFGLISGVFAYVAIAVCALVAMGLLKTAIREVRNLRSAPNPTA